MSFGTLKKEVIFTKKIILLIVFLLVCCGTFIFSDYIAEERKMSETTTVSVSETSSPNKEKTTKVAKKTTTKKVVSTTKKTAAKPKVKSESKSKVKTMAKAKSESKSKVKTTATPKAKTTAKSKPKQTYDVNANLSNSHHSSRKFVDDGRYDKDPSGYILTYYSEHIRPGKDLKIPGRHLNREGYVCDNQGFICLASSDLSKGTVVKIPFGNGLGRIYDDGCDSGIIDVYLNSEFIYENFSL